MIDEIRKEYQHYLYEMISKDYFKLTSLFLSFVMSINVNWPWYIHFLISWNWKLTISRLWNLISVVETKRTTSQLQAHSPNFPIQRDQAFSLCIAVIGATGELARRKIFQALFALYYSGFLPEVVPQLLYLVRPLCLLSRVATARVFFFHQAYCFHCCSYYVFTFLDH